MAHRLILVRHAKPIIDPEVAAQGWKINGSEIGVVSRLATRLRAYGPDGIVSSLEPKALETGRVLA